MYIILWLSVCGSTEYEYAVFVLIFIISWTYWRFVRQCILIFTCRGRIGLTDHHISANISEHIRDVSLGHWILYKYIPSLINWCIENTHRYNPCIRKTMKIIKYPEGDIKVEDGHRLNKILSPVFFFVCAKHQDPAHWQASTANILSTYCQEFNKWCSLDWKPVLHMSCCCRSFVSNFFSFDLPYLNFVFFP